MRMQTFGSWLALQATLHFTPASTPGQAAPTGHHLTGELQSTYYFRGLRGPLPLKALIPLPQQRNKVPPRAWVCPHRRRPPCQREARKPSLWTVVRTSSAILCLTKRAILRAAMLTVQLPRAQAKVDWFWGVIGRKALSCTTSASATPVHSIRVHQVARTDPSAPFAIHARLMPSKGNAKQVEESKSGAVKTVHNHCLSEQCAYHTKRKAKTNG